MLITSVSNTFKNKKSILENRFSQGTDTGVYSGLDLLKLIASFFIVLLHALETDSTFCLKTKFIFTRFAVPFFFIASGYLLFQKLQSQNNAKEYFFRYEKKLLLMFAVWSAIYLPFVVKEYIYIYIDAPWWKIVGLVIRRAVIIGAGPYWYLLSLSIASAILYMLWNRSWYKTLYCIMGAGFLLLITYTCFEEYFSKVAIMNRIHNLISVVFSSELNFFMYGVPFMGLGFVFAKKGVRMRASIAFIGLVIFTVLRVYEYKLPKLNPFFIENRISLLYIMQAIFYFLLAMSIKVPLKKKTSQTIRQLSSFIYLAHVILLYNILNPILMRIKEIHTYTDDVFLPKAIFIILLCIGLFFIIKKINNKYVNFLINA